MNADPKNVIVTESHCSACSAESVEAYHQSFPEMRLTGTSAGEAVERLAGRLKGFLDVVCDPPHREPVRQALADIRVFLNRERQPARG
jgi:hypothetical protein